MFKVVRCPDVFHDSRTLRRSGDFLRVDFPSSELAHAPIKQQHPNKESQGHLGDSRENKKLVGIHVDQSLQSNCSLLQRIATRFQSRLRLIHPYCLNQPSGCKFLTVARCCCAWARCCSQSKACHLLRCQCPSRCRQRHGTHGLHRHCL